MIICDRRGKMRTLGQQGYKIVFAYSYTRLHNVGELCIIFLTALCGEIMSTGLANARPIERMQGWLLHVSDPDLRAE